jgi:Polysulphide reductase, NrfD
VSEKLFASASSLHDGNSYYGRPVIKEPVWAWEIPTYFFVGGTAGAANALALGARLRGYRELADRLGFVATAGLAVSPCLLISDLGRPERFLNMLRVFKVTSPMNVGSWAITIGGGATGAAFALERLRVFPGLRLPRVRRAFEVVAAVMGLPIATYTGALVADTAVPVWHEARRELPVLFAASSAAAAGAAGAALTPVACAAPARRLAVLGGVAEIACSALMERRLGPLLGEPYRTGPAGVLARAARTCTAVGAAAMLLGGRRRTTAAFAGGLLVAGSALERWAVFRAGFQSARDPRYTVEPQRNRIRSRDR